MYPRFRIAGTGQQDGRHADRGLRRAFLYRIFAEDGREPLQLYLEFCCVAGGHDDASAPERELRALLSHATVVFEL